MIIRARFVVPIDQPPIENGAVQVERGRVAGVGRAASLPGEHAIDYGDAVILPGFVNAHTHLELTHLEGRVPPTSDFVAWLQALLAAKAEQPTTRESVQRATRDGLEQAQAAGVTLIGDITCMPEWTREVLGTSAVRGVSFGEVISVGTRRRMLTDRLDAALAPDWQSDSLCVGVSPHAPYSVEPDAMRACVRRARDVRARLCIHLLETADEDRFTRDRVGPFAEYLRALGIWDDDIPTSGCGAAELAVRTGVLGRRTIVAHANYAGDVDIALIAASGASVAYCPRTHRAFGHPPHRFRDMLVAGVNVCIGTDSLASNPSLSVLDELRFLRRSAPDLPAETILEMGTLRGARALGFEHLAGSISTGKAADLVIVPCGSIGGRSRWQSVLESEEHPFEVLVSGSPATR